VLSDRASDPGLCFGMQLDIDLLAASCLLGALRQTDSVRKAVADGAQRPSLKP